VLLVGGPNPSFTSAIETAGASFTKRRKRKKKIEKDPTISPSSTQLGE
jgi:hypothetical protein